MGPVHGCAQGAPPGHFKNYWLQKVRGLACIFSGVESNEGVLPEGVNSAREPLQVSGVHPRAWKYRGGRTGSSGVGR